MAQGFRIDHAGFTRLATGTGTKKHMRFVGEYWKGQLAAYAQRTFRYTAVRRGYDAGTYVRSLEVDLNDRILGKPRPLRRTGVVVAAKVRYAAALEYGNAYASKGQMPKPLTHILDQAHQADPERGRHRG